MLKNKLFVLLQYFTPQHCLSRFSGWVSNNRWPWLKNTIIRRFIKVFKVNMKEALQEDPEDFGSFNEFFIRHLKPELRPLCNQPKCIISPADGTISQIGEMEKDAILQAKHKPFSLKALVGGDESLANTFYHGHFATLYLAPNNYHRFHMPVDGTLKQMIYIPGRLFSVNTATTTYVDDLFARNERVVCVFETACGPMAVILVGAMLVASIHLAWHGKITPRSPRKISQWTYDEDLETKQKLFFKKGEELGYFELGSTVIVLFSEDAAQWHKHLEPNMPVKMGLSLGEFFAA